MQDKMDTNFTHRYSCLIKIKERLLAVLGSNVFCAIAYGSTLCEDFYCHSDFDILLFLNDPSITVLQNLKSLKEEFSKEDVKIDFNVHSSNEVPGVRKDCFWHNNRSLYFQKEITLYGLVLIGENPFLHNDFKIDDLRKESVRVVNSLLYQTRKLLINRNLSSEERINIMKWCIYSVLYAMSFKGVITKTKTQALELFSEYYSFETNPLDFLRAKQKNEVSDELVAKAYKFLTQLDNQLFEEYKNGRE